MLVTFDSRETTTDTPGHFRDLSLAGVEVLLPRSAQRAFEVFSAGSFDVGINANCCKMGCHSPGFEILVERGGDPNGNLKEATNTILICTISIMHFLRLKAIAYFDFTKDRWHLRLRSSDFDSVLLLKVGRVTDRLRVPPRTRVIGEEERDRQAFLESMERRDLRALRCVDRIIPPSEDVRILDRMYLPRGNSGSPDFSLPIGGKFFDGLAKTGSEGGAHVWMTPKIYNHLIAVAFARVGASVQQNSAQDACERKVSVQLTS